ncbi:MAG: acyl-CoA dehydrogenase family protein [Acidimicrobiales bacterium]
MDLRPSEEQALLVASAERLLREQCPPAAVRVAEASPDGHDRSLWAHMAALGWPGLVLPGELGGHDQGALELALVAEQLGRAACSSPLVPSTASVGLPLSWCGGSLAHRLLPAMAAGQTIGAFAHLEASGDDEWSPPTTALERRRHRWQLVGAKHLVPFAAVAGVLLVSAVLPDAGMALVAVDPGRPGVALGRQRVLGGDPLYRVAFDVAVEDEEVVARDEAARRVLERSLAYATAGSLAYAAGLAATAVEMSVAHATGRQQFGRPIGSFQAVAHRCAEMRADADALRLLALQAAWALDRHQGGADHGELAIAKAYANVALRQVFVDAHQVHGAIGFSMEHDLQLFTRRAKAFELSLGSTRLHRRRVAVRMGL